MDDPSTGAIDDLPSYVPQSTASIDVLEVHEVTLVEVADIVECFLTKQQAGAAEPVDSSTIFEARVTTWGQVSDWGAVVRA